MGENACEVKEKEQARALPLEEEHKKRGISPPLQKEGWRRGEDRDRKSSLPEKQFPNVNFKKKNGERKFLGRSFMILSSSIIEIIDREEEEEEFSFCMCMCMEYV